MWLVVTVLTQQCGIRTWIRTANFPRVVASIIAALESHGPQTTTTETTTVNITYLEESQSKCFLARISQLLPLEDYSQNKVAVHSRCCLDNNEIRPRSFCRWGNQKLRLPLCSKSLLGLFFPINSECRTLCTSSAGVVLSKTNTSVSRRASESIKVFFKAWNSVSKSMFRFSFDMAEGCHIELRWMPCGRRCQEVWWGGCSPPGAANQYTSQTFSSPAWELTSVQLVKQRYSKEKKPKTLYLTDGNN